MMTEEVVPQLAANMNAAFKKVWKIIGVGRGTPVSRVSTAEPADRPISLHALFIAIIITRARTTESVEPAP
jgi:hypothetical protein